MTDEELTALAREGDLAAFGTLVDRHRAAVIRVALAALGNRADAEDVAQETFIQCHRALAGFRGDSTLRTWLLAVAWRRANSARRSIRRWWRQADGRWEAGDEPESAGDAPSPERCAAARETHRRVATLVRSLPARLRDPLLLAASGEYSMQEIADLLGAPVGTVKWRVAEARRLLREKLERHDAAR